MVQMRLAQNYVVIPHYDDIESAKPITSNHFVVINKQRFQVIIYSDGKPKVYTYTTNSSWVIDAVITETIETIGLTGMIETTTKYTLHKDSSHFMLMKIISSDFYSLSEDFIKFTADDLIRGIYWDATSLKSFLVSVESHRVQ